MYERKTSWERTSEQLVDDARGFGNNAIEALTEQNYWMMFHNYETAIEKFHQIMDRDDLVNGEKAGELITKCKKILTAKLRER